MKGPIAIAVLSACLFAVSAAHSCEDKLPLLVTQGICTRIRDAVTALHEAVTDMDEQVHAAVVGFLDEATEIVRADTVHLKEALPPVLQQQTSQTQPTVTDVPAQLQSAAQSEATKLALSVKSANQEMMEAITTTIASAHDANDQIAQAAREIMQQIFANEKRSLNEAVLRDIVRRSTDEQTRQILDDLDKLIKDAIQEPIKYAEGIFTRMLDIMTPSLKKSLLDRVNVDYDHAKADVIQLTSYASTQLGEYYDAKVREKVNAAVTEVQKLISELYKTDPSGLKTLKSIIEEESKVIHDAVRHTQTESQQDVIDSVRKTGEFLSGEYTSIIDMLKKY